jgi:membrane protein DedA with SNARE-associated domain
MRSYVPAVAGAIAGLEPKILQGRIPTPNRFGAMCATAARRGYGATLQRPQVRRLSILVLAILPLALLTAAAIAFRSEIQDLANFGYLGLFLWNVIASGTLIVPLPGLLVAGAAASVWNPILVALASAAGSTLGEGTSYFAGRGSHSTVKRVASNHRMYIRIDRWMQSRGAVTLFIFAVIPLPFFDVVGFAAGSLKYPIQRFAVAVLLGKIVKFMTVAALGYWVAGLFD